MGFHGVLEFFRMTDITSQHPRLHFVHWWKISQRNKQDNTHTQTIGCPPSKCDEFHHGNLGNRGISGQFPGQVLVYTIKDTSEWNGQMWPCIVCMNFSQYFFNLVAWPRLTGQARNAITLLKKQLDDATVGSSTSAEHQGFQVAMLLHQGSLDTNRCGFRKSVARIHTCTF